jgi:hypothetical protein
MNIAHSLKLPYTDLFSMGYSDYSFWDGSKMRIKLRRPEELSTSPGER